MLKNLKIGIRLALAFGAVVALLIVLAVLSMQRMSGMNEATRQITENAYPKVVMAKDMIRASVDMGRQMRNMLLSASEEESSRYRKVIEANRAAIATQSAQVEKMLVTDKGRALFKNIADARAACMDDLERGQHVLFAGMQKRSAASVLPL